jgi:hypothetical protein
VALRDVCIGTLQIEPHELPPSAPTPDVVAGMLARLTGVRGLRVGIMLESIHQERNNVRTTEYLQAIIRVWGAQLRALEVSVRMENPTPSLAVVPLGWDRLTALEYLRIHHDYVLEWTALADVRFRPGGGLLHVTGRFVANNVRIILQYVDRRGWEPVSIPAAAGAENLQWTDGPPRHVMWDHDASTGRPQTVNPLLDCLSPDDMQEGAEERKGDATSASSPSDLLLPSLRVKSLTFNCRHFETLSSVEDVQRDLQTVCHRYAHLSQIHLRVTLRTQVDLRPLSLLPHLRVIRLVASPQPIEPAWNPRGLRDKGTATFMYRLMRGMEDDDAAPSSSSHPRDRDVTTYPSVEEITIDGEDLAHIRVAKDAKLPDLTAVAFPHLHTLRFIHAGFQLAFPLTTVTGVFHQLRHLAWGITPARRGEVDVPVEDTLRQLLDAMPLLETLHLNEWWLSGDADVKRLRETYNGLLPMVCASPNLRRVSLLPSLLQVDWHDTPTLAQSQQTLVRFHLLWHEIDPTHRLPEEGMDEADTTGMQWIDAMADDLYSFPFGERDRFSRDHDPAAPLALAPPPTTRAASWLSAAVKKAGDAFQQLARAVAAPVVDRSRPRALHHRRALIEAEETALRARIREEVQASGREVTPRSFEFRLVKSWSHGDRES